MLLIPQDPSDGSMEFDGRGPAASAADDEHFPDEPPAHGDAMLVIRDALLSQLQMDRLCQEIIVAGLAKIDRAMALRSTLHHGIASCSAERATAVPFASSEPFLPHGREADGPERNVGVEEVHDQKKEDGVQGGVELKAEKRTMEDLVRESVKTCRGTDKMGAQENAALDECKPQEFNEKMLPKKTSPSVKWSCAICQVEATSEGNLLQHFAGLKHRSNVVALKTKAKAEKSRKARQYAEKPRPTWVCKFCQANCTGKSDLENHLKGKRHQAKIQSLLEESKRMARNSVSWEADSGPIIAPQDEEKPACSVWICSVCQVKCTCQSVMESHLGGKKHRMNVQALQLEAKRVGIMQPKISKNQQPPKERGCSICQAKCNSESQFEDHVSSMGHLQKIEALHREGMNAQSSSLKTGKKLPLNGSNSSGASSEEMEIQKVLYFCKLCNLQCNSKNTLAEHRRGKKHLEKVEKRMLLSFCETCNFQCNSEKMLARHRTGKKHLAKLNGSLSQSHFVD